MQGSRAKLTWRTWGVTYFARDPLRFYFDERKNEMHFLIKLQYRACISKIYYKWAATRQNQQTDMCFLAFVKVTYTTEWYKWNNNIKSSIAEKS